MNFFLYLATAVGFFVSGLRTAAGHQLQCDARCLGSNQTQVFRQRKDGSCTESCINRRDLLKGYRCGPCPVLNTSRYDVGLGIVQVPAEYQSAFTNAAARWERVIKGDLPETNAKGISLDSHCSLYLPVVIDDIFICAAITNIDGPGIILGRTGVTYIRDDGSYLPLIASMEFDASDMKNLTTQGHFNTVILHEMGHSFGISSEFWQRHNLQNPPTFEYAINSFASKEWQKVTGCKTAIPVEQDGNPGTRYSHWDEDCLQGELMTGYLRNGTGELSRMTVGTLKDLGYEVDFKGADKFGIRKINSTCIAACRNGNHRRQLGTTTRNEHTPPRPERKLTEASKYALAYGKNWLNEKNANEAVSAASVQGSYSYVGDQMVTIWYWEDDGSIRSIEVSSQ